jgi:fatty acid desaturase
MTRLVIIALFPLLLFAVAWWGIKYCFLTVAAPDKAWRLAVSVDQLANSAFNGNEDETLSSRAGRHSQNNADRECWAVWLCWLLDKVQKEHCKNNIGE